MSWADGPFKLLETPAYASSRAREAGNDMDAYIRAASVMALTHNALLRGLNSIYLQAPRVDPKDYEDFVGYAHCFYGAITSHHLSEENNLFPAIVEKTGEKGIMDINIEQHHEFEAGVSAYEKYLSSLKGKEQEFNASHLISLIDAFGPALYKHLKDEIPTLLALSRFESKLPLLDMMTAEGRRMGQERNKTTITMFFFLNLDVTYEDGLWLHWPPIPWPVKWVLLRGLGFWHSGFWKFASCDYEGRPKRLYV